MTNAFDEAIQQLVVVPSGGGRWQRKITGDPFVECPFDPFDAAYEDENGRLPHEPGYIDPHHNQEVRMAVSDALTQGRRNTILDALQTEPRTTRDLEARCEVSRGSLGTLLRDLEREGAIRVVEPGDRTGPAVYDLARGERSAPDPLEPCPEPAIDDVEQLGESALKEDARNRAIGIEPEFDPDPDEREEARERYVALLADTDPARLLRLVESGRLIPDERTFDAIERWLFT